MFYSWGLFSYKHRKVVPLLIVAAILVLFGVFGTQLGDRMSQEGWDDPNSASTAAATQPPASPEARTAKPTAPRHTPAAEL